MSLASAFDLVLDQIGDFEGVDVVLGAKALLLLSMRMLLLLSVTNRDLISSSNPLDVCVLSLPFEIRLSFSSRFTCRI